VNTDMSAETNHEGPAESGRQIQAAVALGRRRLLRGGLSAAPVIMTLASGPVSAGLCRTGSAYGSMNPSGTRRTTTCGGHSPSVWNTTNHNHWPIDANALFSHYFSPGLNGNNVKLKKVIDPSNGYDPVARNCVAALLNACSGPPLTPSSILGVAKAQEIWSSYARNGYFEPTAGIRWNSAKIVDWMTTTYS
jgi:hypothetical protein